MANQSVATEQETTMQDYAAADFSALLSDADMKELETTAQDWGVTRRLAFGILSRDKAQLVAGFQKEEMADTMMNVYDDLKSYMQFLQGQIEILETASIRLLAAGATAAEQQGLSQ